MQGKLNLISSIKNLMCGLPREMPNDLRLKGNKEILVNIKRSKNARRKISKFFGIV